MREGFAREHSPHRDFGLRAVLVAVTGSGCYVLGCWEIASGAGIHAAARVMCP